MDFSLQNTTTFNSNTLEEEPSTAETLKLCFKPDELHFQLANCSPIPLGAIVGNLLASEWLNDENCQVWFHHFFFVFMSKMISLPQTLVLLGLAC